MRTTNIESNHSLTRREPSRSRGAEASTGPAQRQNDALGKLEQAPKKKPEAEAEGGFEAIMKKLEELIEMLMQLLGGGGQDSKLPAEDSAH